MFGFYILHRCPSNPAVDATYYTSPPKEQCTILLSVKCLEWTLKAEALSKIFTHALGKLWFEENICVLWSWCCRLCVFYTAACLTKVYTTDMGFLRPDIVHLVVINVCNGDL